MTRYRRRATDRGRAANAQLVRLSGGASHRFNAPPKHRSLLRWMIGGKLSETVGRKMEVERDQQTPNASGFSYVKSKVTAEFSHAFIGIVVAVLTILDILSRVYDGLRGTVEPPCPRRDKFLLTTYMCLSRF